MKTPKIFLTLLLLLVLATTAASAAYYERYQPYYNHNYKVTHYPTYNYKPNGTSGNCGYACPNGNCYPNCTNCNYPTGSNCPSCPYCKNCNTTCPSCPNGIVTAPSTTPADNSGSTTAPPTTPKDNSGLTTVPIMINGVYELGGNGQILYVTRNESAVNPTYNQLISFLKQDQTDAHPYTSNYVCADFAAQLYDIAEAAGIKCAWVGAEGCNHAFNEFQTTDKGTIFIDDTGTPGGATLQDKILNVQLGQPLTGTDLFISGTVQMGCVVTKLDEFW